MKYNFDKIIDRKNNNAAKLLETKLHFGTNDVIPLWVADMDFSTAQPIIDAIKERADQGIFGYTHRPDEYFKAIACWLENKHGYKANIEHFAFAPAVVPAMRLFIQLFAKADAKIMILQPLYNPLENIVLSTDRTLIISSLIRDINGKYSIDFEDFEKKAKENLDFFILCNPHNPIGKSWSIEDLTKISEICLKHGVEILSDEIHCDLMLSGKHIVMAGLSKQVQAITTTFMSASKTFNLAGLQASSIIFNEKQRQERYTEELRKMDIARNNCFSLVATIAAYQKGEEWLEQLLDYLRGNIAFIAEYCNNNIPKLKPNKPDATYLVWIDASELGMNDDELKDFLVNKAGVALSMGAGFGQGGSGFLRLNAASPRAVLKKALDQIKEAISTL